MNSKQLEIELSDAIDWCMANGLSIRLQDGNYTHAPFSLKPVEFPSNCYQEMQEIMMPMNKLVDDIAQDYNWLHDALKEVCLRDLFTARLVETSKEAHCTRVFDDNRIRFGIHRSDYMLNEEKDGTIIPKQIELNTISAAAGSISSMATRLHKYLSIDENSIEDCTTVDDIPKAMFDAHKLFGNKQASILFVVQEGEWNMMDQRHLEHRLKSIHGLNVMRRTLNEVKVNIILEYMHNMHLAQD
eukprot:TRINITY_DN2851_c0_g1_i2.p1 TRINITY_DN2851_c0_g1~~TRINITY_DN2851_c0_g1_i2.p1  ORF type:complete len:243 (+),score=64.54 TRINITY_DN2851_c0_g1_i2:136-864(+)